MTEVTSTGQQLDVIVKTPQPTTPPSAIPPNIGLVQLSKIETAETPESVLAKLITVDGAGSLLDADMLDGQHGAYYADYNNLANKPSSFPPTLPINQSDVVNLPADLASKVNKAGDTMTGPLVLADISTAPLAAPGSNTSQIASTAFVTAAVAAAPRLLTGSGAPSAGIGALGQYYLDTATGKLYGPKTTATPATYTLRASASADSTGSALSTSTFTPTAGALLIVMLASLNNNGQTLPTTVSDSAGLTWTLAKRQLNVDGGGAWSSSIDVFTAVATGAPTAVTANWYNVTSGVNGGHSIVVAELAGGGAVVQTFGDGGPAGRIGAYAATLASAPSSGNFVFSIATGNGAFVDADITPLTGFTQIYENLQVYYGGNFSYRTGSTSTAVGMNNFDFTGNTYSWSFVSVEIDAGSAWPLCTDLATQAELTSGLATKLGDAPSDGLTYGRKNAAWSTIVGGAVISDTAPAGPLQGGQLWWESDSGALFLWYPDPNSQQWVQVNSTSPAPQPRAPIVREYQSSDTWVKPPDCIYITIEGVAGGGSGGGISTGGAGTICCAGGGGSGGFIGGPTPIDASTLTSVAITVGAGGVGTAGTNGGTPGAGGATSIALGGSFGTISLSGGGGGQGAIATTTRSMLGGWGGAVTNARGGGNTGHGGNTSASNMGTTGAGASSLFGTGAPPNYISGAAGGAGNAATSYGFGAGGSGAFTSAESTGTNRAGGAGSAGYVRIIEYYG